MLENYRLFDADAHAMLSPLMWEDLPPEYRARRPRPVKVDDAEDMGRWNNGWLIEGQIIPHALGSGSQPGNEPARVLQEYGAPADRVTFPLGSLILSDPAARLRDLDRMRIDHQVLFPTTLFARMTADAGLEAALYRAYNRYVGKQCQFDPRRLKWAGLLPLRDQEQAVAALEEMQHLGALAAVVYGTARERLLSHPSFTPVWDAFATTGLPLCVHMGMSYPPFEELSQDLFAAHAIGMTLPAQLAFVAIVGHGMLDRYPDLKVGFLEFGAEWIFYMVGRLDHYLPIDRSQMPIKTRLPRKSIEEYVKSGQIFLASEAEDPLLPQEMALIGEDQILYSSDVPHGEGRESAAHKIIGRSDLTDIQKRKLLYDNSVRFFGEP